MAETGGNVEAAANYIMGHMDESEEWWLAEPAAPEPPGGGSSREYPADDAGEHAAALAPLLSAVRVPSGAETVHKEECAWSFARPTSSDGLNVSLSSFVGVGGAHLDFHVAKTGERVYLNITARRRPAPELEPGQAPATSVADKINAEVQAGTKEYDTVYTLLALLPSPSEPLRIPLTVDLEAEIQPTVTTVLPGTIMRAIDGVLAAKDKGTAADLAEFKEEIKETKLHLGLVQEDNGKKLSPNKEDWKCDVTGDTIGEGPGQSASLWLNLADGFVGGGRKNWDGSGGNNTAVDHYEQMKAAGKEYPLSVKLGTITPEGADIFSYPEDCSVAMPKERLAELLAHWGVDIMTSVKTEKDMQELELELNLSHDFSRIVGEGRGEPVYGAGRTGLINMGNSCYLNSVVQCLFAIPEWAEAYAAPAQREAIFGACSGDPTQDFFTQLAKLGAGLCCGDYSAPPPPADAAAAAGQPDEQGVRPKIFKMLVGKGHAEFSSSKQQDAQEYFIHLIDKVERACRAVGGGGREGLAADPSAVFAFELEERYESVVGGAGQQPQVCYKRLPERCLPLLIPMEAAVNGQEVEQYQSAKEAAAAAGQKFEAPAVVPDVPFAAAMGRWSAAATLDSFRGGRASRTVRFATLPQVLAVWVKREVVEPGSWRPKKLEVALRMPESLDLSSLRVAGEGGLQPGEVAMEEAAAEEESAAAAAGAAAPVPEEALMMLMSMGFPQAKCEKALRATGNSTERATDWIFSHMDDDSDDAGADAGAGAGAGSAEQTAATPAAQRGVDGSGIYKLLGFISHIGKSVTSGHYVCHLRKGDQWLVFNDEKVEMCPDPPLECGYLYFYRRDDEGSAAVSMDTSA
jgi:ubiquitin carboxyl-terminal hydrolase 5/13